MECAISNDFASRYFMVQYYLFYFNRWEKTPFARGDTYIIGQNSYKVFYKALSNTTNKSPLHRCVHWSCYVTSVVCHIYTGVVLQKVSQHSPNCLHVAFNYNVTLYESMFYL